MFEKGGQPSLIISTLEALAVLVALKVFTRKGPVSAEPRYRGNGAALNKLMTTRYPASAVLMELASHMKASSMKVQVEWAPRSGNQEADELANGVVDRFSPELRVDVVAEDLKWQLLPEALRLGREAEKEYNEAKQKGSLPNRSQAEEETAGGPPESCRPLVIEWRREQKERMFTITLYSTFFLLYFSRLFPYPVVLGICYWVRLNYWWLWTFVYRADRKHSGVCSWRHRRPVQSLPLLGSHFLELKSTVRRLGHWKEEAKISELRNFHCSFRGFGARRSGRVAEMGGFSCRGPIPRSEKERRDVGVSRS